MRFALRPTQLIKSTSRRPLHPLNCIFNKKASSRKKRRHPKQMDFSDGLNIAVEGCCHGELDTIYDTMKRIEDVEGLRIDLLICCGDFQAVRNMDDLECMAVPNKYKRIMSFYKYYNGTKMAPYPTLFIGGNHEAINHLRELYYGGWVAPNIYFLGYSGVVQFGGLRIAGISGIYNERHYNMGYYERLPYNEGIKRSTYHTRVFDVFKLKQIKEDVDVLLSHDWPDCITDWGNTEELIQKKPFFRKEIRERCLGSPAVTELLNTLQPKYHFSAHLHVKYPALVDHGNGKQTRFLALDKCLPRRDFLQILNVPTAKGPKQFSYDKEWLGILKSTIHLMSFGPMQMNLVSNPSLEREKEEAMETIMEKMDSLIIPENFEMTAKGYNESEGQRRRVMPQQYIKNPQTERFLQMLGIPFNLHYGNRRSGPSDDGRDDAVSKRKDIDASLITFE